MSDSLSTIETAIAQLEHAKRVLKRIKGAQVRNTEHRDFFRSLGHSWFRSHRVVLVPHLPTQTLESIDRPFRSLLDATSRAAAASTYESELRAAKAGLLVARGLALVPTPTARTGDQSPKFAALAADLQMQVILTRRWEECVRCLAGGAPLAAIVMMGGLLEALLVSRANKLGNKSLLFSASATPMDGRTRKPLELRQWTLAPYIDVGHELGWISRSAKDVAMILRDYRNFVHPEKERVHGVNIGHDDAVVLWEITKSLSKELLAMKGHT